MSLWEGGRDFGKVAGTIDQQEWRGNRRPVFSVNSIERIPQKTVSPRSIIPRLEPSPLIFPPQNSAASFIFHGFLPAVARHAGASFVSLRGVTKSRCRSKRMKQWMAAVNAEAWDPRTQWIVLRRENDSRAEWGRMGTKRGKVSRWVPVRENEADSRGKMDEYCVCVCVCVCRGRARKNVAALGNRVAPSSLPSLR